MGANIVEGKGTNMPESKRDKIEALLKALMVFSLIFFGIFAFGPVFPDQCEDIASNRWMFVSLLITLGAGFILCTINTLFPHRQETKREKAPVIDLKDSFTHIIALIITIPLIIATVYLLVAKSNNLEELTFISGLLGVIVGFYFGHRGIESAESRRDDVESQAKVHWEAKVEADKKALETKLDAEKKHEEKRKKMNDDQYHIKELKDELNRHKKDAKFKPFMEFWDSFKEEAKNRIEEVKKIDLEKISRYPPWEEEEPMEGWSDGEKGLITRFEKEWELYDMDKKKAWNRFKEETEKRIEILKKIDLEKFSRYPPWGEEPMVGWNKGEEELITRFEEEWTIHATQKSKVGGI